jgi:hypothetical protein
MESFSSSMPELWDMIYSYTPDNLTPLFVNKFMYQLMTETNEYLLQRLKKYLIRRARKPYKLPSFEYFKLHLIDDVIKNETSDWCDHGRLFGMGEQYSMYYLEVMKCERWNIMSFIYSDYEAVRDIAEKCNEFVTLLQNEDWSVLLSEHALDLLEEIKLFIGCAVVEEKEEYYSYNRTLGYKLYRRFLEYPEIQKNEQYILSSVAIHYACFEYVPGTIRTEKLIREACLRNTQIISYAPDHIRRDKDFLMQIMKKGGDECLLDDLDADIKCDRDLAFHAVGLHGYAYNYLTDATIKNDKNLILLAIKTYPYAYDDIEDPMQSDIDILMAVTKLSPSIISRSIAKDNIELLKRIIAVNPLVLNYLEDDIVIALTGSKICYDHRSAGSSYTGPSELDDLKHVEDIRWFFSDDNSEYYSDDESPHNIIQDDQFSNLY